MSVSVGKLNADQCIVTVAITNVSLHAIELETGNYPWRMSNEDFTIALIVEDGLLRQPLAKMPMIYDAVNDLPLILQPGESKLDEICLDAYYKELPATLRRHDVTLLWAYQPRVKRKGQLEPLAGVMRLSRKEGSVNHIGVLTNDTK